MEAELCLPHKKYSVIILPVKFKQEKNQYTESSSELTKSVPLFTAANYYVYLSIFLYLCQEMFDK